jgi:hypothetical protein
MTTSAPEQTSQKSLSGRRFRGRFVGGAAMLLLILVSRAVTSDLIAATNVTQRSCSGKLCVERLDRPDLLFVSGFHQVRVGEVDADGQIQGRYRIANDPFDNSDVTIEWTDGGVTLSDTSASLRWDAAVLGNLNN